MTHSITTRLAAMSGTVARRCLPALAALLGLHLAIAPVRADLLFVGQYSNNTIVSFDTTASLPTPTTFATTGLDQPYFLAFDAAGNLYAANSLSNTIERFTPGGVGSVFASAGLSYPVGLAFDAAGNLYVANEVSNTIEKFTPGGVGSVFASTGLNGPAGLAFDKAGNLYVANNATDTIERFTPNGVGSIFASTGFNPTGLAFDSAGNLYTSLNNDTIERFTPGGVGSVFASTLNEPTGLAFDSAGNLFVANLNGNTIERFTPSGVGSLFADSNSPLGLAFGPSSVPEPSSLVLAIIGATVMLGYGCFRSRKTRRMAQVGRRVGAESNPVQLM